MGLGTAVASGLLVAFVGFLLFFLGFWIKLKQEENLLLSHFPEEYPALQGSGKGASAIRVLGWTICLWQCERHDLVETRDTSHPQLL